MKIFRMITQIELIYSEEKKRRVKRNTQKTQKNAYKWDFYFDAFKLIKSSLKKMNKIISY